MRAPLSKIPLASIGFDALLIAFGALLLLFSIVAAAMDIGKTIATSAAESVEWGTGFSPYLIPDTYTPGRNLVELPAPSVSVLNSPLTISDHLINEQVAVDNLAHAPMHHPSQIIIPAIELDAPVVDVAIDLVTVNGKTFQQWLAPGFFAAGWHNSSAALGAVGNTVLNGHHNAYGQVFAHLADLQVGDIIYTMSGEHRFAFVVKIKMILPERFATIERRLANAQWIAPTDDVRLTLVTCYPYESNTHRLIIVAEPLSLDEARLKEVTPRLTPLPTALSVAATELPSPGVTIEAPPLATTLSTDSVEPTASPPDPPTSSP